MKSQFNTTTRASLISTAAHHSKTFACLVVGAAALSTSAMAVDITWDGDTDTNWNNGANWPGGTVPTGSDNAFINDAPNSPLITAALTFNPNEIKVGTGSGAIGRVNHTGGSVSQGGWSAIGEFGGTGTYNLTNNVPTGGTLTGFGTGSGSFSANQLFISRQGGGTSEMLVNTSGSVNVSNDMFVGNGGVGIIKWDAGTLNRTGGWMYIGSDGSGGVNGDGAFNIGGGTINAINNTMVGSNPGSIGVIDQTGGTYTSGGIEVGRSGGTGTWTVSGASTQLTSSGEVFVGRSSGSVGTFQVNSGNVSFNNKLTVGLDGGDGTMTISGTTSPLTVTDELFVGRSTGSTGAFEVSSGSVTLNNSVSVGLEGGSGTMTVSGTTTPLISNGEVYIGRSTDSFGTLQISSGEVEVKNWLNVGRDGGDGNLQMTGGSLKVQQEFRIGYGLGGVGALTMSGGAQASGITASQAVVIGGDKGKGTATVTGTGTSLSSAGEFHVGNSDLSVGQLIVSGGTVSSASWFGIGRDGATGTLTIDGTGVVNQGTSDTGSRLELTNFNKPSTATLNLDGGTLTTSGIVNGANGTCNVYLHGGLVKPTIDNESFLQGMTSVTIKAGGAKFDTDGKNIVIGQSMVGVSGDGGLMKSGLGRLRLSGANTYSGMTTVTAGTFGGSGSITGPLTMQGGTLAPGADLGSFAAGNTTIQTATLSIQINGNVTDVMNVNGVLDLSSTTDTLRFSSPVATLPSYVIANYTSRVGTFNTVTSLPAGYTLNYGATQMTITRPLTPFETWAQTYFPNQTNQAIIGAAADPDTDGQPNNLEFALGGNPNSGSNNAKIYHLNADSSDAGSDKELLVTVAVRDGGDGIGSNPVFSPAAGGQPAATQDGMTYTIEGGADLAFTGTVSVVDTVATGLPAAPAGYEYRTFSLDGSNSLPGKGFMRVKIMP